MFVKQISVFIENRRGRLAEFTKVLGEAGIDLIALSVADTTDFGILRAIVKDTDAAVEILKKAGYTVSITDVLAVAVKDRPGGLASVIGCLNDNGISIEYLYSLVRNFEGQAVVIFRVDKLVPTYELLKKEGVTLLDQSHIRAMQ